MKRRPPPEHSHSLQDVCLGVIAGAHGVAGLVRVQSFSGEAEDIAAYGPLHDAAGTRYSLEVIGRSRGQLLVRIAGVGDRDAATALRGTRLHVPRSVLPPPDDGEYYHTDLIGLQVEYRDGSPVGVVASVHNFGAGDLVDVRLAGSRRTVLLPFDAATVLEVDLEAGSMVVDPMPGLLDNHAEDNR